MVPILQNFPDNFARRGEDNLSQGAALSSLLSFKPLFQMEPSSIFVSSLSSSDSVDIMIASAESSLAITQENSFGEPSTCSSNVLTSSDLVSSTSSSIHLLEDGKRSPSSCLEDTSRTGEVASPSTHSVVVRTTENAHNKEIQNAKKDEIGNHCDNEVVHEGAPELKDSTPSHPISTPDDPLPDLPSSSVPLLLETLPIPKRNINTTSRRGACCMCAAAARYTCPACGKSVCSIACSRSHKEAHPPCSGIPDPTAKVLLKDFTDRQFIRDFRFLEDCRRVLGNIERHVLPGERGDAGDDGGDLHHSTFHGTGVAKEVKKESDFQVHPVSQNVENSISSVSPCAFSSERKNSSSNFSSLALQQAALRRGICCYILSPGMTRRMANTSHCLPDNRIYWRCEFNFYAKTQIVFSLSVDGAMESAHLSEILADAWCLQTPQDQKVGTKSKEKIEDETPLSIAYSSYLLQHFVSQKSFPASGSLDAPRKQNDVEPTSSVEFSCAQGSLTAVYHLGSLPVLSSIRKEEDNMDPEDKKPEEWIRWNKMMRTISTKGVQEGEENKKDPPLFSILYKFPRQGCQPQRFCKLLLGSTLLNALQRVKVITEYPSFEVVMTEDLHLFPLMSDEEYSAWCEAACSRLRNMPHGKGKRSGRGRGRKKVVGGAKDQDATGQARSPLERPISKRGRGGTEACSASSGARFSRRE